MAVEYQVKYTPGFDPTIVNVSQNDVGRQFDLKIIDETGAAQQIPSGSTVKFVGMKPSGLGFTVNCTFTNSVVHVTTTDIMTDEHGLIPAEVQITNGNTVIGTANVNLRVEKNPHPEGTIDDNLIRIIPTFEVIYQRLDILESSMYTAENNISNLQTRVGIVEVKADDAYDIGSQAATMASAHAVEIGGIKRAYDGTVYQTAGDAVRAQAFRGTDTTLTVAGKAADAKTAGDQLTELKNDLNTVNDGYYNLDLIPNKYILRDNGQEANYNGWSATDYIPVQDNSLVIFTAPATLSWGALYDKNKQYISTYGWNSGETKNFFHDGDLRYFRISGANSDMENVKIRILPTVDTTLTKTGYPADAKTVGERLTAIEATSGIIPSYYETQLAAKETIIRGHFDDCAYNGDGLIFLTDTHFSADLFTSATPTSYFNANNSFALIEDIFKKCAIDKIVFGGDLVNSAPDIDTMLLCMASFGNRFGNRQSRLRYCVGNHEYFTGSDLGQTTKPTPSELYGAGIKYNEDAVLAKGDMDTYFFDNAVQKIRYFVVSCGRNTETSVAQVKFVLEQFEDVPEGYKVICIGHGFMADNMAAFRGGYKPIADALDAVKVGGSYTYVYGTNLSETYDYSALVDVTPVCMITGHTHIDGSLTTSGGIPCICTTTDSYAQNYELVDGTPTSSPRTKGTTDEQAFDVIQFDFSNRKIYCTRIGYGSDREFSY